MNQDVQTFYKWLTRQQTREDEVGYFARKVFESNNKKPGSSDYLDWFFFTEKIGSPQLIEDLNDAWEEYKADMKKS
jgi:uncharacterized protein YozE (UPF0346 family)